MLGLAEPPAAACEAGLYRLAQGRSSVEEFLEQFGHRGPDEMELAAPVAQDSGSVGASGVLVA